MHNCQALAPNPKPQNPKTKKPKTKGPWADTKMLQATHPPTHHHPLTFKHEGVVPQTNSKTKTNLLHHYQNASIQCKEIQCWMDELYVSHEDKDIVEQSNTNPQSICEDYLNHPLGLTLLTPGLVTAIFSFICCEIIKNSKQTKWKGLQNYDTIGSLILYLVYVITPDNLRFADHSQRQGLIVVMQTRKERKISVQNYNEMTASVLYYNKVNQLYAHQSPGPSGRILYFHNFVIN